MSEYPVIRVVQVVTDTSGWLTGGLAAADLRDQHYVNGLPVTPAVLNGMHRWHRMGAKP